MQEKELVLKARAGDEEAFASLVSLYRAKIFQHCLGIVKDEELAEDLVQETFIHAFTHLDTFRMQSTFYTWVYRIAHNLSLNFLKKDKRGRERELKEEIFVTELKEEVEDDQFNEALQEALKTLPSKQRIVFEMFYLEHIPHKEIAARLDIPPGTVRSRLFNARKNLHKLFSVLPYRT